MTALTKITSKSSCQHCGAALLLASSGRRKRFCSDACRQAAFRNEKAARYPSKGDQNRALQPIGRQYDFLSRNEESGPSRSSAHSSKELIFEKLNSITHKLTDGTQINAGGGRTSRALGYVMEIYPRKWMARVGNLGSGALSFAAAKEEAIRLYSSRAKGGSDWTRELNVRTAEQIDRTVLASERRKTTVNLMGGSRRGHVDPKVRTSVLEAEVGFLPSTPLEALNGDDYPVECDANGFPELPGCLDRRHKPTLAEAA
jgi:hypothetical protein